MTKSAQVLSKPTTTIRGLPHSISHTAFPFSETLRYRIDLEHGVDRFLLHKLLAHAQYNQSNIIASFWRISALRFDGRNVPTKRLIAWASRAITYEEIERDFDAEAAEEAKVNENCARAEFAVENAVKAKKAAGKDKDGTFAAALKKAREALAGIAPYVLQPIKRSSLKCSFALNLSRDKGRVHVVTMCFELNLHKSRDAHVFRVLWHRQMYRPGEKWWGPTPANLRTCVALSAHPGCTGEDLSKAHKMPHGVQRIRFLYTVTTGAHTVHSGANAVVGSFRETVRRERFTLDLEDDIQHAIAAELLERASSGHCYQEWILECVIKGEDDDDREQDTLQPIVAADEFGMGTGQRHLPQYGTFTCVFASLVSQPGISDGEWGMLLEQMKAQDRDLDRLALLRNTDTRGLRAEHVAEIARLFLHTNRTCDAVTALLERGCLAFGHMSAVCRLLIGMDQIRVQGIARYLGMYANTWRTCATR